MYLNGGEIVTVPVDLPTPYKQSFIQSGEKPIRFEGQVFHPDGHKSSRRQWAKVTIDVVAPGVAVLSGDTKA